MNRLNRPHHADGILPPLVSPAHRRSRHFATITPHRLQSRRRSCNDRVSRTRCRAPAARGWFRHAPVARAGLQKVVPPRGAGTVARRWHAACSDGGQYPAPKRRGNRSTRAPRWNPSACCPDATSPPLQLAPRKMIVWTAAAVSFRYSASLWPPPIFGRRPSF